MPILTCPACNKPSPVGATHPRCLRPWLIDGIFAASDFRDPIVKKIIKNLKYKNAKICAQPLGNLMSRKISGNFSALLSNNNFALSPVPLHPSRLKQRGFNQSQAIAEVLSSNLSLGISNVLTRLRPTRDQTKLDKVSRQTNIEDAFALSPDVNVKDLNFIIVDDVCTTGATLKECAKVLKRNGANMVWGAVAAKE